MPELHLLAGPNGSGKSTFVRELRNGRLLLDYMIPRIINPDEIAVAMNPINPDAVAAAGREALVQRETALFRHETFAMETTFSGKSERRVIAEAGALGYRVTMTYIALDHPEDNVFRVQRRAEIERRNIPAEVVRRRYDRSLTNLTEVADLVHKLDIFGNSKAGFQPFLTLRRGRIDAVERNLPGWVERTLQLQIERHRSLEC